MKRKSAERWKTVLFSNCQSEEAEAWMDEINQIISSLIMPILGTTWPVKNGEYDESIQAERWEMLYARISIDKKCKTKALANFDPTKAANMLINAGNPSGRGIIHSHFHVGIWLIDGGKWCETLKLWPASGLNLHAFGIVGILDGKAYELHSEICSGMKLSRRNN